MSRRRKYSDVHGAIVVALPQAPFDEAFLRDFAFEHGSDGLFKLGYAAALADIQNGKIVLLDRGTLQTWADFAGGIVKDRPETKVMRNRTDP